MVEKPKPDYQIDVYVDGCWLDGVNHNPTAMGGYGVYVVENKNGVEREPWQTSGSVHEVGEAEIEAVWRGLRVIQTTQQYHLENSPPPTVILHTDQEQPLYYIPIKSNMKRFSLKKALGIFVRMAQNR